MTQGASSSIVIRMPTPTNTYSTQWANTLISSIELQSRNSNLAQNTSSITTQEVSEAVSWFNG
jgi:hypothetical protein|tara:strand:+ start:140 stop:328 length:189 start_codon:yes stop_codon:yes gene_type:complete